MGQAKFAVRVQLDPNMLVNRGIGLDDVQNALMAHNANLPTGTLWGAHQAYTVQADGQLNDADGYRPIIVTYRNGSPVRLGELGKVVDGIENDKNIGWFDRTRAITLQVMRQPGTNTVEIVDRIKLQLPQLRSQLPPAVGLEIFYDRSDSIRESINDVQFTLLLAVALVILVIFVFLRNVSATIIPSLALPLSIVGTFAAMSLFGYTIDNLSMMALTLAVGFVVDDAIVVLENIVRHMEMGTPRFEAALEGAREIGFTILSMTLSLAAVFLPVMFMSGIIGRLFHEFAVVIMVAILISGFVSLSLTPMLCSRFLKPPNEAHGALYRAAERFFDAMRDIYGWSLRIRGLRTSFHFAARSGGHFHCDDLSLWSSAEGIHSRPGSGFHWRPGGVPAGCFVRIHGGFPAESAGNCTGQSQRRARHGLRERAVRFRQNWRQVEAALRAKSDARAGDRATPSKIEPDPQRASIFY